MNHRSAAINDIWSAVVDGVGWFFGNLGPAFVFALVTLAAATVFYAYYWAATAPRKRSLEWIAMRESRPSHLTLTLPHHPFEKRDILPMLLITILYAVTAFFQLGSREAPQSYRVFADTQGYVTFSYGQEIEVDEISYYTALGEGTYLLEYSTDGETWDSVVLDQGYNTLFKWQMVDVTAPGKDGEENEIPPHGPIQGSQFRLSASDFRREEGLWLAELVLWKEGRYYTPVEVSEGGEALFDEAEQWTAKYTYMNSTYFDEIYHARTALEHIENVYPYEVTHPPLGKLIIALGIQMFGMTPFGWRFMGTLFGVLMLPILYLFLKNLFGKTVVAVCGTCLFAFEFMHLVQTRISTIDTYGVFFVLLSYYFMYRWLTVPAGSKLRRSVLPLFLSGLFWGIGCAAKWTVIYGGLGLALLWLLGLICKGREWKALRRGHEKVLPDTPDEPEPQEEAGEALENTAAPAAENLPRFAPYVAGTIALSVLFFVMIPLCVYVCAYIPYAAALAERNGASGFTLQELLKTVWDNQVYMLTYHADVHTPHPYESDWYQWIVDGRPILYYRDLEYQDTLGVKSLFASFNNPLISWTGLAALIAMGVESARLRCGRALFILIAALSQFLPWLFIGRILFAYHYFPTVLFLVFAITYLMDRILERKRKGYRLAVYGFTTWAGVLYAAFYPALIGLYTPTWYNLNFLRWFPSWPL